MGRAGFVLVGGKSSRMGRDKALLPAGGVTLVEHLAAKVVAAAGWVALVGPPERYEFLGFPVIPDQISNFGPVAGIQAALQSSTENWNLILACDMPSVTAEFLCTLFDAAERSDGECLVPYSDGLPEPLCAVYHRNCVTRMDAAVREDIRKVSDAIAPLRVIQWPVRESAFFHNLNTPEDVRSFAEG